MADAIVDTSLVTRQGAARERAPLLSLPRSRFDATFDATYTAPLRCYALPATSPLTAAPGRLESTESDFRWHVKKAPSSLVASYIKATIENELAVATAVAEEEDLQPPSKEAVRLLRELLKLMVPSLVDSPQLFYAASADGSGAVSFTLRSEHPRRATIVISPDGREVNLIRIDEHLRGEQVSFDHKQLCGTSEILDWLTSQDACADA